MCFAKEATWLSRQCFSEKVLLKELNLETRKFYPEV